MTRKKILTTLQVIAGLSLTTLVLASGTHAKAMPLPYVDEFDQVYIEEVLDEASMPIAQASPIIEEKAIEPESFTYRPNRHKDMITLNEDYMGWIQIEGTKVNYPFVKHTDNDYYLDKDLLGRYDKNGSIFMDHRNIGFEFSNHVILYGHNMKDGAMFGDLDKYKEESFALENDIIIIEDLYGTRYFQIYASYFDDADASYTLTNLNKDALPSFISDQLDRSDVAYGLIPTSGDKLLTLVTCSYEVDDGRFFIHGKEIDYVEHSSGPGQ